MNVVIDIKPGSDPNAINLNNKGVISVAILGGKTFDVTCVKVDSLRFGPAGALNALAPSYEDVNGDGYIDLMTHYRTQDTGIAPGDTKACLKGELIDGIKFTACDSIKVISK